MNASVLKESLRRHHRALVMGGVALLLVSAWLASAAYASPIATTRLERRVAWTEESAFAYRVPVTRNSTHYALGTELPMGEPAYFRTVSDAILVDHSWTPTSDDPDARGVVGGRLSVHVVATSPDGRPYWEIDHLLDEATVTDATQGLTLSGRVDLDALVAQVGALGAELPVSEGTINWSVRASVVYAFEAHGRRDQGESEWILPIDASDPRFTLPPPDKLAWTEEHAEDRATTEVRDAGVPGVVSDLRALAAGALGLALLVAGLRLARVPDDEPFDAELSRFKEWVSTAGRIPDHAADPSTTVDVRSLEDLIHVAADARTRVVLDERSRVFYAFLPGATYRYARHAY